MSQFKTYALPFITNQNPSKTLYWSLYDDLSGGFFHTTQEVAPLGSILHLGDCETVWSYLKLHNIIHEGVIMVRDKSKNEYIKALGKPVLTKVIIPKIVW